MPWWKREWMAWPYTLGAFGLVVCFALGMMYLTTPPAPPEATEPPPACPRGARCQQDQHGRARVVGVDRSRIAELLADRGYRMDSVARWIVRTPSLILDHEARFTAGDDRLSVEICAVLYDEAYFGPDARDCWFVDLEAQEEEVP